MLERNYETLKLKKHAIKNIKKIKIYQKPESEKPTASIKFTITWQKNMKKNNIKFIELSLLFFFV